MRLDDSHLDGGYLDIDLAPWTIARLDEMVIGDQLAQAGGWGLDRILLDYTRLDDHFSSGLDYTVLGWDGSGLGSMRLDNFVLDSFNPTEFGLDGGRALLGDGPLPPGLNMPHVTLDNFTLDDFAAGAHAFQLDSPINPSLPVCVLNEVYSDVDPSYQMVEEPIDCDLDHAYISREEFYQDLDYAYSNTEIFIDFEHIYAVTRQYYVDIDHSYVVHSEAVDI